MGMSCLVSCFPSDAMQFQEETSDAKGLLLLPWHFNLRLKSKNERTTLFLKFLFLLKKEEKKGKGRCFQGRWQVMSSFRLLLATRKHKCKPKTTPIQAEIPYQGSSFLKHQVSESPAVGLRTFAVLSLGNCEARGRSCTGIKSQQVFRGL